MPAGYIYLVVAILGEISATTALKSAEEFTRPLPTLFVVVGYGIALVFLSLTLRSIPVGVAYATWAGLGTALIAVLGFLVHRQALDLQAIGGMALIIAGVIMMNTSPAAILR